MYVLMQLENKLKRSETLKCTYVCTNAIREQIKEIREPQQRSKSDLLYVHFITNNIKPDSISE